MDDETTKIKQKVASASYRKFRQALLFLPFTEKQLDAILPQVSLIKSSSMKNPELEVFDEIPHLSSSR